MVDALDSKSSSNGVSVRVGPGAPFFIAELASSRSIWCAAMDKRDQRRQCRRRRAELDAGGRARLRQARPAARLADPDRRHRPHRRLPFALRAGAEFFLPVTAALVVAIALVPMLEWFERRGVPSKLASRPVRPRLPGDRRLRHRLDRHPGDRLGGAGPAADRPGARGAGAGARPLQEPRAVHRPDRRRRSPSRASEARTVRVETPNSMLGLHHRLGAACR